MHLIQRQAQCQSRLHSMLSSTAHPTNVLGCQETPGLAAGTVSLAEGGRLCCAGAISLRGAHTHGSNQLSGTIPLAISRHTSDEVRRAHGLISVTRLGWCLAVRCCTVLRYRRQQACTIPEPC